MPSESFEHGRRLALRLNAGIAVTFLVGVLLNLAQAVAGDQGSRLVERPWSSVRVVVGVLFLGFVVARLVLWISSPRASRPDQPRS